MDEYEPIMPEGDIKEYADSIKEDADEGQQKVEENSEEATTDATDATAEENPDDDGEAKKEDAPQSSTDAKPAEGEDIPKTVTVRYNHEDRMLTLDELKAYAQKGIKFDEVSSELTLSKELAKKLGHASISEMAKAVDEQEINRRADEYIDDGVPEKLARRLAKEDYERESLTIREETQKESKEEAPASRATSEITEFIKAYPNVKFIPPEAFKIKQTRGVDIVRAYAIYEAEKAKAEAETLKQNASSAKKAPVVGATKHGATGQKPKDPFLDGFDEA